MLRGIVGAVSLAFLLPCDQRGALSSFRGPLYIVIEPFLSEHSAESDAMRQRFLECFALQLERRLEFNPGPVDDGLFETFVCALESDHSTLLF